MFTGLIEKTAQIISFSQNENGAIIKIGCNFWNDVKTGDSIAVNGACLTVINNENNILSFEISKETLSVANFEGYKVGKLVNLERAMKINSRFDGHIVSGHIDGIGIIKNIVKDGFSYNFEFKAIPEITKYIVKKGSVAINGISLTVINVSDKTFNVEVIPHTLDNTTLSDSKIGDKVNIETDILSRYVEKFLYLNNNNSKISMEMLKENGYI